jgi:hypothetical protein
VAVIVTVAVMTKILFIYWSSPLLFNKLLIIILNSTVTVTMCVTVTVTVPMTVQSDVGHIP